MATSSYLSKNQKEDLLVSMAGTGENYDKYLEWCDRWKVPVEKRFTKKYLHTWIQRRRPKFQAAKAEHQETIRKMSMYDRERRVHELEQDIAVINSHLYVAGKEHSVHQCTKCGYNHEVAGPETALKLIEQKRKLSQAIAIERGEWGKTETKEEGAGGARDRLRAAALEMLAQAPKTTIIDQR